MGLLTLVKAGVLQDVYFLKNNRSSLVSMFAWPYLMLGLMLGMGFFVGNAASFKQNVGMNVDPVMYFLASTVVAMASLSVMWEVGGSVLHLRWTGTLPYILLAPHRISATLVLSFVPRYLLFTTVNIVEFAPVVIAVEGLSQGAVKIAVLLLAVVVGMTPLLGFSAILGSFLLSIKEESNVLSWLNPLILLFSGAFYPAYLLPYWAQLISRVLPTTYTFELARLAALIGSPRLAPITFLIGILAGMSVVYNSIAYVFMGRGERRALKRGAV